MTMEAVFVLMVVCAYFGVILFAAAAIVFIGALLAALAGPRGMAHGNRLLDRVKYAIQRTFG